MWDSLRLEPRPGGLSLRQPRDLVVRGLGLVHVVAFLSLWVQIHGLVGSEGILPAEGAAEFLESQIGVARWWRTPSVYWLWPSDAMLHGMCGTGVALGLVVLAGRLQGPALLILWALTLSFASIGQVFVSHQGDLLLLEASFLGMLVAPWWRRAAEPSPLGVTLLRWLAFKVVFLSGLVKLLSGDPTWLGLTAFETLYWAQPLPSPLSWYLDRLPHWVDALAVAGMLAVELVLSWGFLLGRRPRLVALVGTVLLMLGLQLTGNFGFFPLLTVVVALAALDGNEPARPEPGGAGRVVVGGLFTVYVAVTVLLFHALLSPRVPRFEERILERVAPFRVVNTYGLLAVMPRARPEIVLEGSADGETWRRYDFAWKPDATDDAPRFSAPHLPRLGWTVRSAALGTCEAHPWVPRLMHQLVEGSGPVVGLFREDPFPEGPPRVVRARVFQTGFAQPGSGDWWDFDDTGYEYCPQVERTP